MDSRPSPATLIRGFPNCKTRHPAGLFFMHKQTQHVVSLSLLF